VAFQNSPPDEVSGLFPTGWRAIHFPSCRYPMKGSLKAVVQARFDESFSLAKLACRPRRSKSLSTLSPFFRTPDSYVRERKLPPHLAYGVKKYFFSCAGKDRELGWSELNCAFLSNYSILLFPTVGILVYC